MSSEFGSLQKTKDITQKQVVFEMLCALDKNPKVTQRKLAQDMGIALGLMNTYFKKCVHKGWVRATQISPKRISYFLTPEGFVEKSHMVKEHLAKSFSFFKNAKGQCDEIFNNIAHLGHKKVALVGDGDLMDIANLVASSYQFAIVQISSNDLLGIKFKEFSLKECDAILITDVMNPQMVYELVIKNFDLNRVYTPEVLHISRKN